MKTSILTLATAALIALPPLICAQDQPGTRKGPGDTGTRPAAETDAGRGDRGRRGDRGARINPEARAQFLADKLGLSAEQKEKVKTILEKYAPEIKELMSKGRENLSDEEKTKLHTATKSQHEEIMSLLDDAQKQKMRELRPASKGGKSDKSGRRGGRRKAGDAPQEDNNPPPPKN